MAALVQVKGQRNAATLERRNMMRGRSVEAERSPKRRVGHPIDDQVAAGERPHAHNDAVRGVGIAVLLNAGVQENLHGAKREILVDDL